MPEAIRLTDDQFALVQRIEAHADRLNDNPALRNVPREIEVARKLIEEGAEAGLPEVALVKLRPWVTLYDHRDD